jgi:signal transduction histidine kinase/CheY-like chemotaxis protein/HPt (histidine-containing phosphotransfer) domain-containing protein
LALLGAVAVFVFSVIVAATAFTLREGRDRFDAADRLGSMRRAQAALQRQFETDRLRLEAGAWWDQTYRHTGRGRFSTQDSFLRENFLDRYPRQYGDRFIGWWDEAGALRLVWHAEGEARLDQALAESGALAQVARWGSLAGLIQLQGRAYLLTAAQILPNGGPPGGAPPHGLLATLRPVEGALARSLSERLQQEVRLRPRAATDRGLWYEGGWAVVAGGDTAVARFPVMDVFGRPSLVMELRTPRDVLARLETWLRRSLLLVAALGAALLVLLAVAARRLLLVPAGRIAAALERMRVEGRLEHLDAGVSAREWSAFVEHFNGLVDANARAERALARARDEALALAQARSDFLAKMSHEIRTPMNGLLGVVGLLLETRLDATQRDYVLAIQRSGQALLAMINDILDLSKVEAGKLAIEPLSFDLRVAMEEMGDLLAGRAQEKGLDFVIRVAPEAPRRVVGDPGRIRQVLINLVENAIKFTDQGFVRVNVELVGASAGKARLRFAVEDSGIGIPRSEHERIFDRFAQAESSRGGRPRGTGLGLALCRELAGLMGGRLSVESEEGKGSRFTLELALPVDQVVPQARSAEPGLEGVRVLVADPDEANRTVLLERVAAFGAEAEPAATGAEVIAAIGEADRRGAPFGIVVLDARLPDMNPAQLVELLGALRLGARPVLVLVTTHGRPGEGRRYAELGFAAYFVKPVREADLREGLALAWLQRNLPRPQPLITRHSLAEARGRARSGMPPAPRPAPLRVLVVEDNAVNQRLAMSLLEQLGCRVDVAGSGGEAVSLVARLSYDLVFMDCQMPEMDGYEATRQIRASDAPSAQVPIIGLSAVQGEQERCLAAGMNDYLTKPISLEALAAMVESWAGGGRAGALPAAGPASETVAAAGDSECVLDPVPLDQLRELDAGLAGEIRRLFLSETPLRLVELSRAVEGGAVADIQRLAHSLKGSCLMIGAQQLGLRAQVLERQAAAGVLLHAGAQMGRLWEAWSALRPLVEQAGLAQRAAPAGSSA